MASKDQIDQDALAAEWGVALDAEQQQAAAESAPAAAEQPEGGLRYFDIWQSEQDCDRFTDERLHPVVHPLLAEIFGNDLPPEPERQPMHIIHVWRP